MRFGTWNITSLYGAGSFTAAAKELVRYKLDLVGVQEVTWDREGAIIAEDYNFFYGKGNKNHVACMGHYGNGFTILVGRCEESRSLETACHRWEDVEMAVKVVGLTWLRMTLLSGRSRYANDILGRTKLAEYLAELNNTMHCRGTLSLIVS